MVSLARERYFLLCRSALVDAPGIARVLQALRDPSFRAELDALPGYDASIAGRLTPLASAFHTIVGD